MCYILRQATWGSATIDPKAPNSHPRAHSVNCHLNQVRATCPTITQHLWGGSGHQVFYYLRPASWGSAAVVLKAFNGHPQRGGPQDLGPQLILP